MKTLSCQSVKKNFQRNYDAPKRVAKKFLQSLITFPFLIGGAAIIGPALHAQNDHPQDYQLTITANQKEEFGGNIELWSPHWVESGYFRFARFGLLAGTYNFYQIEESKKRHISSFEAAAGYQISMDAASIHLRSSFFGGYAQADRYAKAGPDGPGGEQKTSTYSYFETRHGFEIVPPTHLAFTKSQPMESNDVKSPQRSLFELGLGLRWNFIGSERTIRAGDIIIREIQIFPYLSAHMFI